ncbi:MAG: hypothetical protein LH472_05045 [Pyrinomonadaceae bacterium]|nr:hypothetical protein [Pyrinomonadaceae bacterium]
MNYKNKVINLFLLLTVAVFSFSCSQQAAQNSNSSSVGGGKQAQSPTEAYKMLFAAVKAKDAEKIKQMMSKNTLGLAQFNAERQKISLEKSVENGLVAPTMSDALTEIRDERVKDNFGSVEVFNQKENRWEDLPFLLEDGGWKLAIGDLFQGSFESPGRSKGEIEREATNTLPMPTGGMTKFPELPANANSMTFPANSTGNKTMEKDKSVEVPKEDKPKK